MPWTPKAQEYLLGDRDGFQDRYCGYWTWIGLHSTSRDNCPADRVDATRKILLRLSELVPDADHSSPGWGGDEKRPDKVPVAVLGINLSEKGRVGEPKIGLCFREGKFYLFADSVAASMISKQEWEKDWKAFGRNETDKVRICTKFPIAPNPTETPELVDPLAKDGYLVKNLLEPFAKKIQNILEKRKASRKKLLSKAETYWKDFQEAQGTVFPKLIDLVRPPKQIRGEGTAKLANFQELQLNTILYGPPGTGKTFATLGLALAVINANHDEDLHEYTDSVLSGRLAESPSDEEWQAWLRQYEVAVSSGRIEFTTFHQNYSYEDFVEGIRAEAKGNTVVYENRAGIFKEIAYRALYAWLTGKPCPTDGTDRKKAFENVLSYLRGSDHKWSEGGVQYPRATDGNTITYLIIIDEINRGNISRILGELITLLEPSKRAQRVGAASLGDQPLRAILPYTREPFMVPPNLYILGTMNTADRSLIGLDVALRRRFAFVQLLPQPSALADLPEELGFLEDFLTELNNRIEERLDTDHLIGHAFFSGLQSMQDLARAMQLKVIPQLREYFHDRPEDLRFVLSRRTQNELCDFLEFDGGVRGDRLRLRGVNHESLHDMNAYLSFIGRDV